MTDSLRLDEFRVELRQRATKKRALAFEEFKKSKELAKPANLAVVIGELNKLLAELRDTLQGLPVSNAIDKAKFVVTERDEDGKIKAFEVAT